MRRPDVIFVAIVFAAAVVVYLVALTAFTANPFVWTVQHPDYAASALLPVLPIAVLARIVWRGGTPVPTSDNEADAAVATDEQVAVDAGAGDKSAPPAPAGDASPVAQTTVPPPALSTARMLQRPGVALERPLRVEDPVVGGAGGATDPASVDPEAADGGQPTRTEQFDSVEELAVASVLDRGKSVAEVARTLKVRPSTVQMWVARSRNRR